MNKKYDYLIIGAGPAGLQLGYFLGQNKRNYLILDKADIPGSFFKVFPRHRKLISINKVNTGTDHPEANLRWDWNSLLSDGDEFRFTRYSQRYFPDPDDLLQYLADFAVRYDINIKFNAEVVKVGKKDQRFIIIDAQDNRYECKRLIIASGLFKPYLPDVPGIELCDNYIDHSINPQEYVNQRVLVIGKGNSGFESAQNLIETAAAIHIASPESVRFAWQTHFVGNLRAVNNEFLDTYQLKSQNTVIDADINKIDKRDGKFYVHLAYSHAQGQNVIEVYDHVIVCTGFKFDNSIFDESCRPELAHEGKLPAQTPEWESVNVPDLYIAGTLMQACDYKKTMSGFIHGFRHNIQSLANIFEYKYHNEDWPGHRLAATPEDVIEKLIDRVITAPGMFLQPGFLGDVIVVSEPDGMAMYYEDIRMDYVPHSHFMKNDHYYTISLEYGKFLGDPFSVERDPDPDKGDEAPYLHPVIRRYKQGMFIGEHHIQDDLENRWYLDIYVQPALEFMKEQLGSVQEKAPVKD